MNKTIRNTSFFLALSFIVSSLPEPVFAGPAAAVQKKQTRKKKSSPKKSSSKKSGSSNQSAQAAQAKKYIGRGKQRIKQKNYAGALSDFQKAHKLAPSKTTQNYIKKLTPVVAASKKKTASKPKTLVASTPIPKPKSPYKLSDNIYKLTNHMDTSTRKMRSARMALKPLDTRSTEEVHRQRLEIIKTAAVDRPEDRRAQRDLALQYETEGRFSDAKDIYLRLIASEPSDADHHFFLGSLYTHTGQTNNARFAFREALQLDPNHGPTIEALSRYSGKSATKSMAKDLMQEVSQKQPNGPAKLLKDVRANLDKGDYAEVLRLAGENSSRFSQSASLVFMKGQAHEATGDLESAKKTYKQSMTIDQSDPRGGVALGDLYFSQGNYLYAAITYEGVLPRDPMNVSLRYKHGLSYYRAFEWGKAASAWEEMLGYTPNHQEVRMFLPEVYYIMSLEYDRTGFTDLSRRAFANALSVNPNSSAWLVNALKTAGEFYRENGMYRLSLRAYQDAMEIVPSDLDVFNGLGATYWYMGEKQMAVAAWEKSLSIRSDDNAAKGWLLLANRSSE